MLEDIVKRLKELQEKLKDVFVFPTLRSDEQYAGIVLNELGEPDYHLFVKDQELGFCPFDKKMATQHEIKIAAVVLHLKHVTYWCKDGDVIRVISNGWKVDVGSMTSKFGILTVRRAPI